MAELKLRKLVSSEKYKITIVNKKRPIASGVQISPLMINTGSNWSAMGDGSPLAGQAGSQVAQRTIGMSTVVGAMSYKSWQGTEQVTLGLSLGFVGITDTFSDVIHPVRELLKLPLPDTFTNGDMTPPVDISDDPGNMVVLLGEKIQIPGLLPVSITPEFSKTKDRNGRPVFATVDLRFTYYRAVTADVIDQWIN